ncbi:hypothetical protein [Pseudonocardia sp. WMMC193]|uniref:hypothetical protein n=1 Tax=Pseudonocardia sp. WMMC193 TaxID=2911965 RepID=UPI001F3D7C19|nr:hypothetical protein [Pseudonocardia sp. WMMC193]MCF7552231.1 hypothetical protein [Pseudonocardia sp. WMMC193]
MASSLEVTHAVRAEDLHHALGHNFTLPLRALLLTGDDDRRLSHGSMTHPRWPRSPATGAATATPGAGRAPG